MHFQMSCSDTTQPNPNSKEFWVNMPNLMTHLKKVSEQKPQATYYNVDMLKYQVRTSKQHWAQRHKRIYKKIYI